MGIKGLANLVADEAPESIKSRGLEEYSGKTIAIDTSISVCQFLNAKGSRNLKNKDDEQTGHLRGLLYRVATFMEAGIKPVYVFDGSPPALKKKHAIAERNLRRQITAQAAKGAPPPKKPRVQLQQQTITQPIRQETLIKEMPTNKIFDQCKKLFALLGIPIVQAPREAEAQCVRLCKDGKAYAEFDGAHVLEKLKLSRDEFIDLCILCGCDYCPNIEGMEAKAALDMIRKHGCLEHVLKNAESYQIPNDWPYKNVRLLFTEPDVDKNVAELQWEKPDEEGVIAFLVSHGFNKKHLTTAIGRINKALGLKSQKPLDDFYLAPKKEKKTVKLQTSLEKFYQSGSTSAVAPPKKEGCSSP
ncbi:unnamed protein product [Urochloa decumbens]|uniref:Flap endonuclease 1 n=1 Tax=Urochloa decumbens TaxID=240449 RepID=A0ABC9CB24_9POAL